jgi:hypothetical protein
MNTQQVYRRTCLSALLVTVTCVLSACASAPIPNEQISLSKDAVNRAVSAGATQYAPLEMKKTQDKVLLMERAIGEKNYMQAKALAEQIEVDASFAERKAQTVKTQNELKSARNGIQVLKNEMLQAPDSGINSTSNQN